MCVCVCLFVLYLDSIGGRNDGQYRRLSDGSTIGVAHISAARRAASFGFISPTLHDEIGNEFTAMLQQ